MNTPTKMSVSTFRNKWKLNFLRVQSGEDICITRYGKVQGTLKTNLNEIERKKAKLKLEKLAAAQFQA